ncbi:MAG: hypothetical protein IAG13_38075 [Deltaproteobacteria bacterium]|nr:hypothetical protein [Nannocystaceae bacterium]
MPVQPAGVATMSPEEMATIEAGVDILRTRAIRSYDNREYVDAAEQWELAYGLVGPSPELVAERQELGFELAHAHVHAHAHDHQPDRLERARALLWRFIAHVARPGHTPTVAERAQVDHATELLEIIGHRLDDDWRDAQLKDLRPLQPRHDPAARPSLGRANALIGAGATALGVGVVMMGVGGGLYSEASRGVVQTGPGMIATLSLGCIFGAAGAVALGSGLVERHRIVRAAPMISRKTAGVSLGGRF